MTVLVVPLIFIEIHGLRVLILQHRAESFPVANGKILSGEVEITRGSKRTYYDPSFSYSYQVNGQNYIGRRYRYDASSSLSGLAASKQIVKEHPVGSEIQVYYNPIDPGDSLLSPRVEGDDIGILLFVFPYCLFILYWIVNFSRLVVPFKPIVEGAKGILDRKKTRVRSSYMPLPMSLLTVGLLSGIAGTIMMITPYVSLGAGVIVVLLISLTGAIVYFWRHKRVSMEYDEVRRRKRAARTE